ncbi:tetratricopeptide repeat (TPR)-like superfamily protein [Tasmannia lanceolata]|uniref:tetratricopeptide repeat (TPR)-like superfamily protein n=1 Tax=Tasmannia lanceolata TaxID=3420 RepID=UPI0040634ED6
MAFCLPAKIDMLICKCDIRAKGHLSEKGALFYLNNQASNKGSIHCSASRERRGFGTRPTKKEKTSNLKVPREGTSISSKVSQPRKSTSGLPDTVSGQGPLLASGLDKNSSNVVFDRQFEERLETVRRSAVEQKKREVNKPYQAIDYDAPIESKKSKNDIGTKVGVLLAVVVFGLVFALGDFLPSVSVSPNQERTPTENKLSKEEKETLQNRLQEYEATLSVSPKDPSALEGASVTLMELGEYSRAASLLEKLVEEKPKDSDAYRLLGEVKYELKDYEGSAAAYRSAAAASEAIDPEVLRGLTNALLAAKKPDEAVKILLATRESLNARSLNNLDNQADASSNLEDMQIDPIQVELLLGKAYSDWGHVSDAVSVYDRLISMHRDDFRGYLAKGIILKENGEVGDAERMFIQARFFAPEKVKALVDRYSRK